MSVVVLGDTHGSPVPLFDLRLSTGDYAIITGDAGFVFYGTQQEADILHQLEDLPFTILFVDGNHENFDIINHLPVETWNGGHVHRISKNMIHLMRGQLFTIDSLRVFCFGGGFSVDRSFRERGINYWPQEIPSTAEYDLGIQTLRRSDFSVDYIITHTAPLSVVQGLLGRLKEEAERPLNNYFERLRRCCQFKKWYFGHLDVDAIYDDNFFCLSKVARDIETGEPVT